MWEIISSVLLGKKALHLKIAAILFCLLPFKLKANPGQIQVWFLVESKVSARLHRQEMRPPLKNIFWVSKLLAQSDFNCIPMGDGCFHPQTGLVTKSEPVVEAKKVEEDDSADKKLRVINAEDVSLIDCKKDYYFDIFCGKDKKINSSNNTLEVWVDNSASLKGIDVPRDGDYCFRRSFAEKLKNACNGKVDFSVYNTSIKPTSDLSQICLNRGGNDEARLIRWISNSNAKKLIVVTDIAELTEKFEIFLNSIGADIRGADSQGITASDLDNYIPEIKKLCL